ncbi:hypothetical protein PCE1_001725 [Barthelona sp. PCE]
MRVSFLPRYSSRDRLMSGYMLLSYLLLSTIFLSARAREVNYADCRELCQIFKFNPNQCAKCQYSDYRIGIANRAHRECKRKHISDDDCIEKLAAVYNPALKSALNKKNKVKNKKIAIVDSQKTTEIVTETIDVPFSGLYEDDLPSKPSKKCQCPEAERVSAGASFGMHGEKHSIKGYMCPRQGCMVTEKLELLKKPITSTYQFKLTDINPPQPYVKKRKGVLRKKKKVYTKSLTHTLCPTITVFFSDTQLRRYDAGTPMMLSTKDGLGTMTNGVQLSRFVAKVKKRRLFHKKRYITRKQPPVALYKADGTNGAIREGDIVCLSKTCTYCVTFNRGKPICVPTSKYRVSF